MTSAITGPGSRPHVPGLPADAPTAVAQRLHAGQRAEDELVADALRQLGQDVPTRHHVLSSDPERIGRAIERTVSMPPVRHTYVPVGTLVSTGPQVDQTWAVVGVDGDQVALARRSQDGAATVQARIGWRELVERSPELLDQPIRDAHGVIWTPYDFTDVEQYGRNGMVRIATTAELDAAAQEGREPRTVAKTWGNVIDDTGLDQRIPEADLPTSEYHAMAVRRAAGDTRYIVSDVGQPHGQRSLLVGTGLHPGLGADIIGDAEAMQHWFRERMGVDVWAADEQVVIRTDKLEFLNNAAASAIGDDAYLFEGPRSDRIRGAWLARLSGELGQDVRRTNELLREHDEAVRAHEGMHVAIRKLWGSQVERIPAGTRMLAVLEDKVVEEALGDIAGMSKDGRPSVGVRELDRHRNGFGDYDQFRRMLAKTPPGKFDVHFGTQLLTAPLVDVQAQHGGDVVAELVGAATRTLGHRIAIGQLTTVDIPTAANAIAEAAAWRFGASSPIMQTLGSGWFALKVLR